MLKCIFATLLLIAWPSMFAQGSGNRQANQGLSALSRVRAQDNQPFTAGTEGDFYCLIASVDHPRAGVSLNCKRGAGVYKMSWGDKFGSYDAFADAASKFSPNQIVHARCTVADVWIAKNESENQIDLSCAPPARAKP